MASTDGMATTTLKVEGMTCGACTSAVESGFKNVEGVGSVSVSLVMERAVVKHDQNTISAEKVKDIIEDRGFDAEVLSTELPVPALRPATSPTASAGPPLATTTLKVEGMTCGACTSAVESGFKDVAGISSVSISLLSERAVVEHDPAAITPEAIAEIIEDRGFDATVLDTKASSTEVASGNASRGESAAQMLTTTTVSIEGMTCGACTSAVEAGFKDLAGLVSFSVSLLAERAIVVHDQMILSTDQIVEIIEDRGFDAKVISSEQSMIERSAGSVTAQFRLFGLQDDESAKALESALLKIHGVLSCSVQFSTYRASVTHNPSVLGLRALVEAIEGLGYNALVADSDDNSAQLESLAKTREIQSWKRDFQISVSFAIPVFLISMIIPMYLPFLDFGAWRILPGLWLGDLLCLLLTIPVQFGIGRRFYISAYKSLSHGAPTMDVLVVLGTSAAFFFSVGAMLVSLFSARHTRPSTVFDTSSMLLTFITLGRFLENRAKGQTSKALSRLMSLAPSMATIYADPIAAAKAAEAWDEGSSTEKKASPIEASGNAAEEKVIPTELLQLGDIVILRPGDKVPADGVVTQGQSYVDESMVTGEAVPLIKKKGSNLMAGTVNGAGRIDFRVSRVGSDTQLSQIVKLVQEAQTSRAPIQRMADIVAGYFVPAIITLGVVTFVFWMVVSHLWPNPPKVFLQDEAGGRLMICLKLCISVIVFACPCALGLSTPTAVMVGTGVGAQNGILVKGGAALETATRVNHVVFDKTGTLTFGKMSVANAKIEGVWEANDWRRRLWWTLIGLAEMGSEHPIGKAIVNSAKGELGLGSDTMIDGSVGDFQSTVGKGISATVQPASSVERQRYRVLIGNVEFLQSEGVILPDGLHPSSGTSAALPQASSSSSSSSKTAGMTQIHIAIDSTFAGTLSLADTLKPTARAAILALSRMGITSSLVTGDQLPTALSIAALVGIPPSHVHAGITPDNKQAIIKRIQDTPPSPSFTKSSSAKKSIVAMVGDGINDSPALATADVGIALSSGTDVAMEAADIVLMRPDDLLNVPAALSLARTIFNRIKLNLGWACLYNVIGLPFAMGLGLLLPGGFMLPPMAAGAAMAASSVSVVGSSLLLKFWKRPHWLSVKRLEKEAGLEPFTPGLGKRMSRLASLSKSERGEDYDDEELELGDLRSATVERDSDSAFKSIAKRVQKLIVVPFTQFMRGNSHRVAALDNTPVRGEYVPLDEAVNSVQGRRHAYGDV